MQFSGSELTLKRNFFTQTGNFGFVMNAVVDNTTGLYKFGVTGGNSMVEFTLNSGRLYYDSQFLHTYKSYQPFSLQVQMTTGAINVIKDGVPLAYGLPKTTGNYNYFYFSRNNNGMAGDFDVDISGNSVPVFAISDKGYLLTSGQNAVTGYFSNQSLFPLRVFDSSIQASQNYNFGKLATTVNSNATGTFAYTGNFNTLDLSQPILTTFNTTYQDTTILFTIVDSRTLNKFVYFTGPNDISFNSSGVISQNLTYLNYSGGFVSTNYNADLTFSLNYLTGAEPFTGVWNFSTGLNISSLASLKSQGFYSANTISGSGSFAPNNQVAFEIVYLGQSGNAATLIISGSQVLNPISQILNFNA